MENVYLGLRHIGYTGMFIFGLIFILNWILKDSILLDQLIGFIIAIIMFISSFIIKK